MASPRPQVDFAAGRADGGAEVEAPGVLEQLAERVGLDDFSTDVLPALKVLAESLQTLSKGDAIKQWTSADWLLGLVVMATHNTVERNKAPPPRVLSAATKPVVESLEAARPQLDELLRFVRISDAVYAATPAQFCEEATLPLEVVVRSFDGGVLSPKFVLLRNDATREIVLAIRGTATVLDFCTDICLINEPFAGGEGHRGIVYATRWLVKNIRDDLARLTAEYPQYQLILTGHSLGAGVAALTAMELRSQFPQLKCIAFAAPASVTAKLADACEGYVTAVVNGDDCVPRLHQHSMERLQLELSQFDWRATLKQLVDEEIEEHRKERDQQMQEIYDAFQRMKTQMLETPLAQSVSASFERTKAAFGADEPAEDGPTTTDKDGQKAGADKKQWDLLEETVSGLESLTSSLSRPQDLQAVVTKSKALLASTHSVAPAKTATVETGAADDATSMDFERVRDRIKSLLDQASQSLQATVGETIEGVSEAVTVTVNGNESDIDSLIVELREGGDGDKPEKVVYVVTALEDMGVVLPAPRQPQVAQESLFTPGRILYLNRKLLEHEKASEAGAAEAVELLQVTNDDFGSVVLSNNMVLDHLCTAYERALQAVAKAMNGEPPQIP